MMQHQIFGDLTYDFWFEKKTVLVLFGQKTEAMLLLTAYSPEDAITPEQEKSYQTFQAKEVKYLKAVENLLNTTYGAKVKERFQLRTLLIDRGGQLALLFDDAKDADEGIAVQILPSLLLANQSDYL